MQKIQSPLDIIKSVIPDLGRRRILDIGCGAGELVRELLAEGADASGVDPGVEAVAHARRKVPGAQFQVAGGEALPFADGTFDLTVMVNALHHVPGALMRQALREGLRVVTRSGLFVVVEPLASGSFFEALRLVEDETEVRHAAQAAIREAVAEGEVKLVRTLDYARQESFGGVDAFVERIVAVDPSRREVAERNRALLTERMNAVAARRNGLMVLDQPLTAVILGNSERG